MKKSLILCAALLACAFGFQSCDKVDNPTGEPLEPTKTVIDNGTELADAVKNFAKEGVLEIPANVVELYVSENIDLSEVEVKAENLTLSVAKGVEIKIGKPMTNVSIIGDAAEPATIVAKAGFVVSKNFALENVKIDATALEDNLVALPSTEAKPINEIEKIVFDNVDIKGLGKALFYSAAKGNLITDFTINNSVIEVAKDITVIDFTKGSSAKNINIKNSTLYAPTKTTKSMYSSQSGQRVTEFGSDLTQTFNLSNTTLYNFAPTKNFFSHRQNSQKWLIYNVDGVIALDCGKVGQVIKGLNGGGQSPNPQYSVKNFYSLSTSDGSIVDNTASENTNGTGTEIVPEGYATKTFTFADVAKGDFTQKTAESGDPRWYNAN